MSYSLVCVFRFNENNVDLNRNAIFEDDWDEMRKRDPNIAGYEDFSENMFNPAGPPSLWDAYAGVFLKSALAIAKYGFTHMKRSLVTAQYHNPKGVYYGGRAQEASHSLLTAFIKGHFSNTKGTVTWIDVHTGLGAPGIDTLLPGDNRHSAEETSTWFTGVDIQTASQDDEGGDVAAGYELTRGMMESYYPKLFKEEANALLVTQEFGTRPGVLVARACILENQAFVHAPEQQPRWALLSRDAFYVRTRSVLCV